MREITITTAEANQRLDKFLLKYLNTASKGFLYKMLRKKNITRNGKKALGSEILCAGDILAFFLSEDTLNKFMKEKELPLQAGPLDILFEDSNVLICNKPAGLLSQRSSSYPQDTLIDRILFYLHEKGEYLTSRGSSFSPGICNRLDRNTSGIVVCGKNLAALQWLNQQKQTEKYYQAIVKGKINKPGTFSGFHQKISGNISVVHRSETALAKQAITEYVPIKSNENASLVEIKLITGKSHQIRTFFADAGHPILGDPKYGDLNLNRNLEKQFGIKSQLLHAHKLVFSGKEDSLGYLSGLEVIAKPPTFFQSVMI